MQRLPSVPWISPSTHLSALSWVSAGTMPPYFSSPFPLPTQRIVGLLTCQTDALAQTLQTRVVHCTEATATSSTGKETNQSKKAAKLKKGSADGQTQQQQWEIELEDTVL